MIKMIVAQSVIGFNLVDYFQISRGLFLLSLLDSLSEIDWAKIKFFPGGEYGDPFKPMMGESWTSQVTSS